MPAIEDFGPLEIGKTIRFDTPDGFQVVGVLRAVVKGPASANIHVEGIAQPFNVDNGTDIAFS